MVIDILYIFLLNNVIFLMCIVLYLSCLVFNNILNFNLIIKELCCYFCKLLILNSVRMILFDY